MDAVRAVAGDYRDSVNFVHVEPYELDVEGQPVLNDAGERITVPALEEWGLHPEPWVFVLDAAGVVVVRLEGALSLNELREAIEAAIDAGAA